MWAIALRTELVAPLDEAASYLVAVPNFGLPGLLWLGYISTRGYTPAVGGTFVYNQLGLRNSL